MKSISHSFTTLLSFLSRHFMGAFMIILLLICGMTSIYTIIDKNSEMKIESFNWDMFLNGRFAENLGNEFEDKLTIKDQAVGLWGALNYGLFNTGNKKVVIGSDEWLFTEEDFLEHKNGLVERQNKIKIITSVHDYLNQNGIKLVIVLIPSKARIYPEYLGRFAFPQHQKKLYHQFRSSLLRHGLIVPDILNTFQKAKSDDVQIFMRLDTHWTPQAAQIAAQTLVPHIATVPLPQSRFVTTQKTEESYEPDLLKYVPTGLFENWIGIKPENYTPFITTAVTNDNESDQSDLFSDPVIPVDLVGTSYSAIKKWNFTGALKQSLEADVANWSLQGKGPMAPMAKYLSNNDFSKNSDTKIVIWEIPERFIEQAYDDVIFPDFIQKDEKR